ncbi:MAG: protoporphyrinogen oxidase [Magnetococcus sp. THC-1_WYH]
MTSKRAIIVGGGISGLSLAFFLRQAGVAVTLLEKEPRVGGVIRSSQSEGFLVEHGPNSTLQKPGDASDALGRVMAQVGLVPQVANEKASRRYVQKSGRLLPLPTSPWEFLQTPLFSPSAKLRLLLEPFWSKAEAEESVGAFVSRRLGPEFLHWAVDPFISGVYAGDPQVLSIRAATPKIYALEERYGSLFRGAYAMRKKGRVTGMPKGRLISFENGMESLITALRTRLLESDSSQVRVMTGVTVERLTAMPQGGWQVDGGGGVRETGDWLFLAIPAFAAAPLLESLSGVAAQHLAGIHHAPVVSMALGFDRSQVKHLLDGFGFLLPGREGLDLLGCLFSSTLFPGRAGLDRVILTAFMGGTRHPTTVAQGDDALVAGAMGGLRGVLGIGASPGFVRITRYERAIAQYAMGHMQRLDQIRQALASWQGLYLCGNYMGGVSVADRVLNSERLAQSLGHP